MRSYKLSVALAILLLPSAILAAQWREPGSPEVEPFGFKQGMTKAQVIALVGEKSVEKDDDEGNLLILTTAPAPHPDFDLYGVRISDSTGLAQVVATSGVIETSVYGDGLKQKYSQFRKALESKYGSPTDFDFLNSGSIWNEPRDWMMGLLKKERTLSSYWKIMGKATISLEAVAFDRDSGCIKIVYEFPNFSSYLHERQEREKAVF